MVERRGLLRQGRNAPFSLANPSIARPQREYVVVHELVHLYEPNHSAEFCLGLERAMQLADLVARPIGLSTLRPNQPNRAFDILKRKFYCDGGRQAVGSGYEGVGMKVFPPPKSEKPR